MTNPPGASSFGPRTSRPHLPHGGGPPAVRNPLTSPRFLVQALVLVLLLSLWTWKLLEPRPVPEDIRDGLAEAGLFLPLQKALHAGAYALLTVLAATLPIPRRWRHVLIGLLAAHGLGTEIGQLFVPYRAGRAYDVAIDWIGIVLGLLVMQWAAIRLRGRDR